MTHLRIQQSANFDLLCWSSTWLYGSQMFFQESVPICLVTNLAVSVILEGILQLSDSDKLNSMGTAHYKRDLPGYNTCCNGSSQGNFTGCWLIMTCLNIHHHWHNTHNNNNNALLAGAIQRRSTNNM